MRVHEANGQTSRRKRPVPKPFRHLILLMDYREPCNVLIDLQPTTLKPMAWKMLMKLAEMPGCVVKYDELYEALWGETVVENNQLSYQKNDLLKGIVAVAPQRSDLVKTIPKMGFMLDLSPREVLIVPPCRCI
jgi:DNA-binding winged helix-turn-helix (wHTH) protein